MVEEIADAAADVESNPHFVEGQLYDGSFFGPGQPCFGCAPDHPHGLHLTFARHGDEVRTEFTPGPHFQGPPGVLHGGLVTTAADELAAWTVLVLRQRFGFTAAMQSRWVAPLRTGRPIFGVGTMTNDTRRLVEIAVTLRQRATDSDDEAPSVCYRGSFTFALLDRAGAEKLLQRDLPPAWSALCRDRGR